MRDRANTAALPSTGRRSTFTVDAVVFSPRGKALAVLRVSAAGSRHGDGGSLPYGVPRDGESLEQCARRLVRAFAGAEAAWIEQLGAFADGKRHAASAELSVGFVAVVPEGAAPGSAEWIGLNELAQLTPRQRTIADAALSAVRTRLDHAPIAFRLLPPQFTLTELQHTYEMLLGKRLHKASFRRALQAAYLVEPRDEWRNEGRGRPAQFYAFSPRKRRNVRRGVRFDSLG